MRNVLVIAAVAEGVTGMALAIFPSLVGWLLFDAELAGVAAIAARVAGIALVGLGIACWPGPPLLGMLVYSVIITFYLAYLGLGGGPNGVLLWPAVILHAIVSTLLGRAWLTRSAVSR